jgi:fido (protein-threonine AMPylation protein)
VPSTTNVCPDWDDAIPSSLSDEFQKSLLRAVEEVQGAASQPFREYWTKWWHYNVFGQFVPLSYYAGNYRQENAKFPCLAVNVHVSGVLGHEFSQVQESMSELEAKTRTSFAQIELAQSAPLNERIKLIAFATAALVGEFIRGHPFLNGNGRTSRLLWMWALWRFNIRPQFRIHPRPGTPYSQIMAAAMRGDDGPLALNILGFLAANPPS